MKEEIQDNEEEIILTTRYANVPNDNDNNHGNDYVNHSNTSTSPEKLPNCAYILTTLAAFSGFLYGYDMTAIRQTTFYIRRYFKLESVWTDVVVSSTYVGAMIFSCLSGWVVDTCGRKATLIASTLFFSAGSTISGLSVNVSMLIAGRFLLGMGEGLITTTTIIYVAECIHSKQRGRMVAMFAIFFLLGQIAAIFLSNFISIDSTRGWRYVLGAATVPSLVQAIGIAFLPESPRWLMRKGRELHAREALDAVTPRAFVSDEIRHIRTAVKEQKLPQPNTSGASKFSLVLHSPSLRRALIAGCSLFLFQILSGGLLIMHFLHDVFKLSFDMKKHSTLLVLAPTVLGVISSIFGLVFLERIGRKRLLFVSIFGVTISLIVSAVGFQLGAYTYQPVTEMEPFGDSEPDQAARCDIHRTCQRCVKSYLCGFCFKDEGQGTIEGSCTNVNQQFPLRATYGRCQKSFFERPLYWTTEICPSAHIWLTAIGFALYMTFYNCGLSFIPWVLNSEIFPFWARGTSIAISTTVHWLCELVFCLSMHILLDVLSKHGTFWVFASLSVSGLIFVWITVPTTTNKSIEEADDFFADPWFSRAPYATLDI